MDGTSGRKIPDGSASAHSVLVVSPRYPEDVAAAVAAAGFFPLPVRHPDDALPAMTQEQADPESLRLVVIDARGALTQGLAVARTLGHVVQARLGAMLVLLSRGDGASALAAHDAGATSVMISPFGRDALGNALRLAARQVERMRNLAVSAPASAARGQPDRLTGLPIGEQLEEWIAGLHAAPAPPPVSVIAIGIGRLAPINAAYGRDIADQALAAAAARLSQLIESRLSPSRPTEPRPTEPLLFARLAAAEFALALATTRDLSEIEALAADITAAFEAPFVIGDHVIHLSARAGIARGAATAEPMATGRPLDMAAALVRRATSALARARTRDAGSVAVFTPDPAGDPLTRLANLEAELHRAIDGGGIHLLYQPQLSLAGGGITGVEALVRWEHPQLGLLPAETVLETAASAELAVRLGRHIRARAIAEAARWSGPLAGLKLSVNVTAADLSDPRFVTALEYALDSSGLARDRLVLEVTEGALIDDVRGAARLLESLHATGVHIALDDFGTGYSSLAWLAHLPIDTIKLDRAFTLGLTATPRERMVVKTLVTLGHQLGLSVVAEGVEDDDQLDAATRAGCDAVQGFRVAPPMEAGKLARFCEAWEPQTAQR
jgi:EAL domain-containing protein (putative c-di-GMP-specific phosphodiesterase class I)/GGDEF domain-containing protein